MATPLTADQIVSALRAEGVKVVEYPGWRTHNRNHKGPWGPVHGVMDHHTVTGPKVDGVRLCHDGHSELPGPLCLGVIRRDGTVHLVGNGRANHAGGGDPDVLHAVAAESYRTRPPVPDVGNSDGIDGNRHFYGYEAENLGDGKDPWPAVQVEAMVRANAALIRAHRSKGDKWGAKAAIGHSEWSDDKSDPRGPGFPGMPQLRERIAQRLMHPASWTPGSTTTPTLPSQPPTGGTVTAPLRTYLSRAETMPLHPQSPAAIYWTGESADEPNDHGSGGKNFLTDSTYAGVVRLVAQIPAGVSVRVQAVRTAMADGARSLGPSADITGTGTMTRYAVPLTGDVAEGWQLSVELESAHTAQVDVTSAGADFLSWPIA